MDTLKNNCATVGQFWMTKEGGDEKEVVKLGGRVIKEQRARLPSFHA